MTLPPHRLWLSLALTGAALAQTASPAPALQSTALGNVFTVGQPVRLELKGAAVRWTLRDANGVPLRTGQAGAGVLDLGALPAGMYVLEVSAGSDYARTTLAVLSPLPADPVRQGAFSLVTHFGQFQTPPKWDAAAGRYVEGGAGRYDPRLADLAALAGAGSVRDELPWNIVEPARGAYVFPPPHQAYLGALREQKLNLYSILNYGNRLYDKDAEGVGAAPFTDEGRQAYANYAAALVRAWPHIREVEVWNEFNSDAPWNRGPCKSDPECYAKMLEVVYRTVKAARPEVQVTGPAAVTIPYEWLERLFALGALRHLDAVTVHPYRYPESPEGLEADLGRLDTLIRQHNGGQPKPIILSEIGWPTHVGDRNVSERTQAQYLVRAHLHAFAGGATRLVWYDLMNDGPVPTNVEHNFGLIRFSTDPQGAFTPKPAFAAYATLSRQLSARRYAGQVAGPPGTFHYRFTGQGGPEVRVLWAKEPVNVRVRASGPLTVTDLYGRGAVYTPQGGSVQLTLGGDPLYVSGPLEGLEAGGAYGLSVSGTESRAPLSARLTWAGVAAPTRVDLAGGGDPQAGGGALTFTLPARGGPGDTPVVADVYQGEHRVARLVAEVSLRDPLTIEPLAPDVGAGGQRALRVTLRNGSATRAQALGSLRYSVGDRTGSLPLNTTLPAGAERVVTVPLGDLALWRAYAASVTVSVPEEAPVTQTAQTAFAPLVRRPLTLDGRVDDLNAAEAIDLTRDARPTGGVTPASLGGQVWLSRDDTGLYVAARVKDDQQVNPRPGQDLLQGDSVQLSVAPGLPGAGTPARGFVIGLTDAGAQVYRWVGAEPGAVEGARAEVRREGEFTVYEAFLPWTALAAAPPPPYLALAVQVNDNDGAGRAGWIEWGAGLGRNTPSTFRPVQLR